MDKGGRGVPRPHTGPETSVSSQNLVHGDDGQCALTPTIINNIDSKMSFIALNSADDVTEEMTNDDVFHKESLQNHYSTNILT